MEQHIPHPECILDQGGAGFCSFTGCGLRATVEVRSVIVPSVRYESQDPASFCVARCLSAIEQHPIEGIDQEQQG